ncbi:Ribulose bisphosphate carboxylase large chain [Ciborinia camelliae]|nr:Ribulose bisphosphate carboxylase large chain [Ciborinia camelliae]
MLSITFNIPSPKSSRRPANIPLRTLSTAGRSNLSQGLLGSDEKQGRRSSLSRSSSPGSEFSWSDTGDLAEQLADEEDPLQIRLRASLDEEVFGGSSKRQKRKRVRYNDDTNGKQEKHYNPGLVKEDIEIPDPGPRRISRTEHILAAVMAGGERQMHGLTGRPLV